MSSTDLTDKRAGLSPEKRALLEQRLRGLSGDQQAARAIPRRPPSATAPLSFAQQRLWFLDQLQPGNPFYNVSRWVRISGALDHDALCRALNEVVARHESLHTVFRVLNHEPVQLIQPPAELTLPVIDLSELPAVDRAAAVQRRAAEHAEICFSLSEGPLLSVRLFRLSSDEFVLSLVLHHIITDAWSTALLLREVIAIYEALVAGQPAPLSELPIQYADFAVWQRDFLKGDTLDRQLNYWKQRLAGAPALLELPLDRPRPAVQTFRGASETLSLPAALARALNDLSQSEGATLFMTLLAAFQTLLWRHTRQDEIVVGAPIANRTRRETESLIGFFVNTLALRSSLKPDMTFRQLLRQVKETTLAAYTNQDLPFEKLVEELQPERSLSHNPIFQVTLSLQNVPAADARGLFSVDKVGINGATARLDLESYFWELPDGINCKFAYSTDIFEQRTIKRLLDRFRILLEGLSATPEASLANLPLLTPDDHHELLARRPAAATITECLHRLFEAQTARTPDRTAISCDDRQLSYQQLNERANQLAHYLIKRGAGPEKFIGICLERSLDLIVALLAILKSGAAYVPLDPAYPPDRLAFVIKDAGLNLILTQQSLQEALALASTETICLDRDRDSFTGESGENPDVRIDPQHPAYAIYTSGSTGAPKGVVVTHHNVARLLQTTASLFRFGADDVWTLFHSYAFDFSVWEIWGALGYGGRLVIIPYLVSRAPEELLGLLCDEQVTVLNQTPSAFRQLTLAEQNSARKTELGLRTVIFGGEALDFQSLRPWFERRGETEPRLVNMYGITETTVHVTYRALREADLSAGSASLIGTALDDLEIYILDRAGQLVPPGVVGEMYVGGEGVARGYLRRPDLTAERFVPHPFSTEPGKRLYRSGDLARRLPGGELEYLGRADRQVKVRGFRIELGEIEAVLADHETVNDCRVLSLEPDQQLVAYVISKPGGADSFEPLRTFARERLPPYMVPAFFVGLERFPLTANGKIDERALPPPEKSGGGSTGEFVAPRTEAERTLAGLWGDVLGRDQIGVFDNFFDLGGHSLLATRVLARIRETFGINLPLRYFFERPTVAAVAEFVRDARQDDRSRMPEIKRLPRG